MLFAGPKGEIDLGSLRQDWFLALANALCKVDV